METFHGTNMPVCTVQLWYNKQRVRKDGSVSLYLQIIVDGEHPTVPLKNLVWPAEKFNWDKKCIEPRSDNDEDILYYNAIIERERAKYWSVIRNFMLGQQKFTVSDIFRTVNKFKIGNKFCAFMTQAIIDRQRTSIKKDMIKATTAKVHRTTLKYFEEFLNYRDIDITAVDGDLLERFAEWSRDTIEENSVWVRIQNIKSYLSYAFRNKIVVNHDYKRFVISMEEADPTWLEEDEINRLLKLYWSKDLSPALHRSLRAFLFACFTGLRISDLLRWNKEWLHDTYISFMPQKQRKSIKNPKILLIPIIPIAREFITDLYNETFELPTEQVYNRELKTIAISKGVEIKKNITSHVARHTFATWLAIDGVPVLAISKLLGHKSTTTTMIYIHIAEGYLAREMMKMQRRFAMPESRN